MINSFSLDDRFYSKLFDAAEMVSEGSLKIKRAFENEEWDLVLLTCFAVVNLPSYAPWFLKYVLSLQYGIWDLVLHYEYVYKHKLSL